LIIGTKVSTPTRNIPKLELAEIIVADARFTKNDGPESFLPWSETLLPQEKTKKEIKHKGIGITLTFETKYSHNWTQTSWNPCKYTTPNPL
jgi:hypothetical protein